MKVPLDFDLAGALGVVGGRQTPPRAAPARRAAPASSPAPDVRVLVSKLRAAVKGLLAEREKLVGQLQGLAEENQRLREALGQARTSAQHAWRGRARQEPAPAAPAAPPAAPETTIEGDVVDLSAYMEPEDEDLG